MEFFLKNEGVIVMIKNSNVIDLLIVEESENVIFLFSEIGKIFGITVKFAQNLDEFVDVATEYNFKFVLSNLHIEYNFAGLFISRMYNNIRKFKSNDGKLFFYSFQNLEISKLILNDLTEEKFANFFDFLNEYFPIQYKDYFMSEAYRTSITS